MLIEVKLKSYMENKARIEVLQLKIIKAKEEMKYANNGFKEPADETIYSMQMSAVVINPDKPSKSNKFSSATESVALNYRNDFVGSNEIDTYDHKRDIRKWESEIRVLEDEIKTIEAAMRSLTQEEDYLIKCLYLEKMYWRSIVINYELNFKIFKSERTLKDINADAKGKLERILCD